MEYSIHCMGFTSSIKEIFYKNNKMPPICCEVCNNLATKVIYTIKTGTMKICDEHSAQFERNGKFDFEY